MYSYPFDTGCFIEILIDLTKPESKFQNIFQNPSKHTRTNPYVCDGCGKAFEMSSAVKLHTKLHTDMYMIHNTPHPDTPLKPFPHSSHLNGFYQANGCKTNEDYAYRGWSHLCSLVNILRTDDLLKAFPQTEHTYVFRVL